LNNRSSVLRRMATTFALTIVALSADALLVVAPAGAATPRVLAIRFGPPDLEVNPVTQAYVNHELSGAEKHYDAAVIELDTPREDLVFARATTRTGRPRGTSEPFTVPTWDGQSHGPAHGGATSGGRAFSLGQPRA
jgi:hypothetical protein